MDSAVLVQRLAATPMPAEILLIDEWNQDGAWLFKPREPEATRLYVAAGSISETCQMMDRFYESRDIVIVPTRMTDDPADWCGRGMRVEGARVSIWVETIKPWREIPELFEDQLQLVEIRYSAYRR